MVQTFKNVIDVKYIQPNTPRRTQIYVTGKIKLQLSLNYSIFSILVKSFFKCDFTMSVCSVLLDKHDVIYLLLCSLNYCWWESFITLNICN